MTMSPSASEQLMTKAMLANPHPPYHALREEFLLLDLRRWEPCLEATCDMQEIYALAAVWEGWGLSLATTLRFCITMP